MPALCFVLMPFGRKPAGKRTVDFDAIYAEIIHPAVCAARLEPLRTDEEPAGDMIHKGRFERLHPGRPGVARGKRGAGRSASSRK